MPTASPVIGILFARTLIFVVLFGFAFYWGVLTGVAAHFFEPGFTLRMDPLHLMPVTAAVLAGIISWLLFRKALQRRGLKPLVFEASFLAAVLLVVVVDSAMNVILDALTISLFVIPLAIALVAEVIANKRKH